MNQTLLFDQYPYSFKRISLIKKYELCRQQSPCFLLIPPPQPPMLPALILNNSSFTSTNHQHTSHSFFIILSLFIPLISICLFSIIFQLYHYLRQQRLHHTRHTDLPNGSTSLSRIVPSSYNSLTPLTTKIDQSLSSTMTNIFNLSHPPHLLSDDQSSYHNHSSNIYEKIGLSSDHHYCSCCLCVQTYQHRQQQQQQHISKTSQETLLYYTYKSLSPNIICQNCLLENLHQQQKCFCHNYFAPIK